MCSKKLWWLLPLTLLAACGSSGNRQYEKTGSTQNEAYSAKTDSTAGPAAASPPIGSPAAGAPINSPERKIIHTADFHCRVPDVFSATTKPERLVKSFGGAVQESRMESTDNDTKTSYLKPDSLRLTKTYTTTAQLILRVPSIYADSVADAIPGLCSFIDSRTLRQSDVTYQYLSNELKNKMSDDKQTAVHAMKPAKKSKDPLEVQEYEDRRQEQTIDRKIQNLNLQDEVSYATITVALAQPQQVLIQTVANPDYYTRTPFSAECGSALASGWSVIKAIFILFLAVWPFLLLLAPAWAVYRAYRHRKASPVMK